MYEVWNKTVISSNASLFIISNNEKMKFTMIHSYKTEKQFAVFKLVELNRLYKNMSCIGFCFYTTQTLGQHNINRTVLVSAFSVPSLENERVECGGRRVTPFYIYD